MEEEVPVRQAKRGAPVHRIWSDAFDEPDVYSTRIPNNAICKHCKQSVRHHHKTLSVETHVRKCRPIQEDHVGHGRGWPPRLVDGSHRERSQEVDGGRLHKFQEQLVRRRQVTAIGSMPLSRRSSTMRWPYITIAQAQASSESKIPISFGLFNWHGRVRDCRHLLENAVRWESICLHHKWCMVQHVERAGRQLHGRVPHQIIVSGSRAHWRASARCGLARLRSKPCHRQSWGHCGRRHHGQYGNQQEGMEWTEAEVLKIILNLQMNTKGPHTLDAIRQSGAIFSFHWRTSLLLI